MVEKISRSEQKRLYKQVEELARELAELSDADLNQLELGDDVKDEIIDCRSVKGGARKRQIKYVAKLLRQVDLGTIYSFLKDKKGSQLKENKLFHKAERWRDVILNETIEIFEECRKEQINFEPDFESVMIDDLLAEFPAINSNDLRQCAYQYARTRNKTHYRELFRMIKAAIELQERS